MTTSAQLWLQDLNGMQPGMRRGMVALGVTGQRTQLLGIWPPGSEPDYELLSVATASRDGKYPLEQAVPNAHGAGRIFPLSVHLANQAVGTVVVDVSDSPVVDDEVVFADLRSQLPALERLLEEAIQGGIGPVEILRLQSTLLSHRRFAVAAAALTNELCDLLRCDRVSIGMHNNGTTRLEAVSHSSSDQYGGDDFTAIVAAMDECIDQQTTILFPQQAGGQPRITLAHADLAKRTGHDHLLTLPLGERQEIFGAMTIESAGVRSFNEDEVTKLEDVIGLIGPLLAVKRETDLSLSRHLLQSATSSWRMLSGPGHATVKAVTAGILLILAVLTLIPVEYRITAPVRLEGQVQRILSAPSEGFVEVVHVRPGDNVKRDQVLVELARQDLQLELRHSQAALGEAENGYGAAMSAGDRTQLGISLARLQESRAKVDLIQGQIDRAYIKAPFDGVVISGDLSQSLGMPVERGHPLLTVAPVEGRRLIIEVDERDIAQVQPGQTGEFVLQAMPGNTLGFTVERITPVASNSDERNFFPVEASLVGADTGLRPGLEGVAKIDAGGRTMAWIWFHRAADWMRLELWRWLG